MRTRHTNGAARSHSRQHHPQLPQRMLDDLPQDLLLAILSNLEVSDIASLRCVCKAWNNFIDENESIVFRAAAVVGLDVPPWAKLPQDLPGLVSPRSIACVSTWKELCQSVSDTWHTHGPDHRRQVPG